MSRGIGLLSGRVTKTPPTEVESVAPDRFTFLDVSTAEADLGVPPGNDYFLTSDTVGNRSWLPPGSLGLNGEENELVFIKNGVSASTTNIEYDEVTDSIKFHNSYQQRGTAKVISDDSSFTDGVIATFDKNSFGSAKYIVQADTPSRKRQISELLLVHDGTNASATEFGVIHTTDLPIAEFDVDIEGDLVRLLATNAIDDSTENVSFRIVEMLMLI